MIRLIFALFRIGLLLRLTAASRPSLADIKAWPAAITIAQAFSPSVSVARKSLEEIGLA